MSNFHQSVLLKKAVELLQIKPSAKYIDATLGGGGHTLEILKSGGIVLGLDQDEEALIYVGKNYESFIKERKLILAKGNFRNIDEIAHLNNFKEVSGIIFDLGVSSYQIDNPKRGFSFLKDGPLDMRMDKSSNLTAEFLVNVLGKGELYDLFNRLGQERRSRAVSNSIVRARRIKAIKTTGELSKIVEEAYNVKKENISDFAKNEINKRVFQALRIAVNSELENLTESLPKALSILGSNGKIAVITFHSLEDGIVKNIFKSFEKENMGKIITYKPVLPSKEEFNSNSRSRSAKLRVFEKK